MDVLANMLSNKQYWSWSCSLVLDLAKMLAQDQDNLYTSKI